ncbi:class I SAM-dependent methyltransferase [candidate division WOR-3 bacterium]|nr:class I SAM-dependent methyltransferase [candidate division WOR-3 bacterium]
MAKKYTVTETWIVNETQPVESTSAEQLYERMPKVSGRLPLIDVPLDFREEGHFYDEAQVRDFLAYVGGADSILDVGTGDGWPALRMAPHARSITAIDAAQLRVATAQANAERLGIKNVTFRQMPSTQLEFADASFDGVVAASSIEQSPDPYQTLRELFRVLRRGGKLRVYFESYDRVERGYKEEVFVTETQDTLGYHYVLRHANPPWERSYLVKFVATPEMKEEFRKLQDFIGRLGASPAQAPEIGMQFLQRNRASLAGSSCYELEHFTSLTMRETLEEIGFVGVRVAYSAATLARTMWPRVREKDLTDVQVQAVCQGLADLAVRLDAPVGSGEPVVATKPD